MKKTALFIGLLAIGTFAAKAQDGTKTPGMSKTQNETKSSADPGDQSPANTHDASNSGSTSASEGAMSNSETNSASRGTQLQISDLPKAISQNISSQHMGWAPKEVYKVDNQGSTAYEVVVNKDADEMSLVYDANGNLLRTEQHGSLGSGNASPQSEMK
jgi:hypothetical protein